MSGINLGENFVGGLRAPHYANGRLLTAEDLKAEQEAFLGRLEYTGEAAGTGIVRGLEVSQVANNLRVTGGVGINRLGQAVRLVEESVELSLVKLPDTSVVIGGDGRFNDCNVAPAEGGSLVETGAYLLVAAPVSQLQGSTSVKAIGANAAACASRWEVEGVQFRGLKLPGAPPRSANNAGIYRNLLAHWLYGTQALAKLPQDPFTFPARYAPLDQLSEDELALCDLPLAVFYWENGVLRFVDQWAVRRRITAPFPSQQWQALLAERRVADAQARFLQFQSQVEEMRAAPAQFPDLAARYGGADFRYLPPVGFLPIAPPLEVIRRLVHDALLEVLGPGARIPPQVIEQLVANLQSRIPATRVFDLGAFFGLKLPWRVGLVDRETIDYRLSQSWYDEALDFAALPDVRSGQEMTTFDVLLVADEIKLLATGLVKLMFNQLTDVDIVGLAVAVNNLGAGVAIKDDGGLAVGFGLTALQPNLALLQGFAGGLQDFTADLAEIDFGRARAGGAEGTAAPSIRPATRLAARPDLRAMLQPNTRRLRAPGLDDFFKLDDAGGMAAFLQAAQLPPQYAVFVKTVKETSWIYRTTPEG